MSTLDLGITTAILRRTIAALAEDGRYLMAAALIEPGVARLELVFDEYGTAWVHVYAGRWLLVVMDLRAVGVHEVGGELLLLDVPLGA